MNSIVRGFEEGYEISDNGETLILAKNGMDTLLKTKVPLYDSDNVGTRVERAV